MFEQATRNRYRYPSRKGLLTTEDLWEVPLIAKDGFDLDTIAKTINRELKDLQEESFVNTTEGSKQQELKAKLSVIVHIIEVKQKESKQAAERNYKEMERKRLQSILASKQEQALHNLTPEELQARIDAL